MDLEATRWRHLTHCNAGARTPLGGDMCICLRELKNIVDQLLPPPPCPHPSSHGWGQISSDGKYDGETWCDRCGKQLTFKKGTDSAEGKSE